MNRETQKSPVKKLIKRLPPIPEKSEDTVGRYIPRPNGSGPAGSAEHIESFLSWAEPLKPPPTSTTDFSSPYASWLRIQLARSRAVVKALHDQLSKVARERDDAYARVFELLEEKHGNSDDKHVLSDDEGTPLECEVCGGTWDTLPTSCPGQRMTKNQMDTIREGNLDFANGRWWSADEPVAEKPSSDDISDDEEG